MFPTQNDLDFIDLQLQSAAYYSDPYNRVTYRLRSLLNELEPMRFRITEPTFFLGENRKPGDILESPVGPYRPFRSENGKMDRVAQFVEIKDEIRQRMSAIDRIKAKALQARTIAPDAIKDFESDLDSLIAEGPKLKAAREKAVGEHREVFTGVRGEIDGLKSAIDILSNGGPPLPESEHK